MTSLITGYTDAVGAFEPTTVGPAQDTESSIVYVIDYERDPLGVYRSAIDRSVASHVRFFASPQEFLQCSLVDRPSCLIVRFDDGGQGVRLLQHEMRRQEMSVPMIVTSDGTSFTTAATLMENGAMTVLQHPPLVDSLRQYIDNAIGEDRNAKQLSKRYHEVTSILRSLTPRQRRVLEFADEGLPNKRIAAELDVSIRTVEVDRSKIMKAFDARSLATVTRRIGELRMLSLWNSHWRFSRPRIQLRAGREGQRREQQGREERGLDRAATQPPRAFDRRPR